jgi:hypothetical protein
MRDWEKRVEEWGGEVRDVVCVKGRYEDMGVMKACLAHQLFE